MTQADTTGEPNGMWRDTEHPLPSGPSHGEQPTPWPIVRGAAAVAALAVAFIIATVDGVGATTVWIVSTLGVIAAAVAIMVLHERTPAARERRRERANRRTRRHGFHLHRHQH